MGGSEGIMLNIRLIDYQTAINRIPQPLDSQKEKAVKGKPSTALYSDSTDIYLFKPIRFYLSNILPISTSSPGKTASLVLSRSSKALPATHRL